MRIKNVGSFPITITVAGIQQQIFPDAQVDYPDKLKPQVDAAILPHDNLIELVVNNVEDEDNASELVAYIAAQKGAANGLVPLDSGQKVPSAYLPNTVMEFKGNWNPNTNTPELEDGTGNAGDVYRASQAGTVDLGSGPLNFQIGDWVIYNGGVWEWSPNSNLVMSVNGQTGVVVLSKSDVGLGNVDNTSDMDKPISNAVQAALDEKASQSSPYALVTAGKFSASLGTVSGAVSQDTFLNGNGAPPAVHLARKITIASPVQITSADFRLRTFAGGGNSTAYILADLAGEPDPSTVLATSAVVNLGLIDENFADVPYAFSPFTLPAGDYWLYVQITGGIAIQYSGTGSNTRVSNDGLSWGPNSSGSICYHLNGIMDNSSLTMNEDGYVQVAGLSDEANKIDGFTEGLADGQVIYVELNLTSDTPTTLALNTVAASDVPVADNVFVVARRKGDNIYIANDLLIQEASVSVEGVVTTGAQSFGGVKTFVEGIVSGSVVKAPVYEGASEVFTFTGDITAGSNVITNVVGAMPDADSIGKLYSIAAYDYFLAETKIAFTNSNTITVGDSPTLDAAYQSGVGVTFYVRTAAQFQSAAQTSQVSAAVLVRSGASTNNSTGAVVLAAGAAQETASSVVYQGLNYQSAIVGSAANIYVAEVMVDGSLATQNSGSLTQNRVYLVVSGTTGNFTNVGGGTNPAVGFIFRATANAAPTSFGDYVLQPIIIAGLGTKVQSRVPAGLTRDQLLAALTATYLVTHDFVVSSAGGANVAQVSGSARLLGAKHAGDVVLGDGQNSVIRISVPYIVLDQGDTSGTVYFGTENRFDNVVTRALTINTGVANGSGNTGMMIINTGDSQGTGGTGAMLIRTGVVRGSVSSGGLNLLTGASQPTSSANTGAIALISGGIQGTAGSSGALTISSGSVLAASTSTNSSTGQISVISGQILNSVNTSGTGAMTFASGANSGASASSSTGSVTVGSGNANAGASGNVTVGSGTSTSGGTGSLTLRTGQAQNQNTGAITIQSGAIVAAAGAVTSGQVTIKSGDSTSASGSGNLFINTGNITGAGGPSGSITIATGTVQANQNSGDILLNTASVSGTGVKGKIRLGNSSTTGYVWTATDSTGGGAWQAPTGGGGSGWTTSIKTVADNGAALANNAEIIGDTSGGAFTLLLPNSPTIGTRVRLTDKKGTWSTNNLTLDRNGENIKGAAANFTLDVNYGSVEAVFADATDGWLFFITF